MVSRPLHNRWCGFRSSGALHKMASSSAGNGNSKSNSNNNSNNGNNNRSGGNRSKMWRKA